MVPDSEHSVLDRGATGSFACPSSALSLRSPAHLCLAESSAVPLGMARSSTLLLSSLPPPALGAKRILAAPCCFPDTLRSCGSSRRGPTASDLAIAAVRVLCLLLQLGDKIISHAVSVCLICQTKTQSRVRRVQVPDPLKASHGCVSPLCEQGWAEDARPARVSNCPL